MDVTKHYQDIHYFVYKSLENNTSALKLIQIITFFFKTKSKILFRFSKIRTWLENENLYSRKQLNIQNLNFVYGDYKNI